MPTPFHQYASRPLPQHPAAAHAELRETPRRLVASATATALDAMAPLARLWGLSSDRLPTVTARPTGDDELGSIELTWSGDEERTAWPSLTGRLVIDQRPGGAHRLALLTRRSPTAELSTERLDRIHRRRLVQVAVQGFLRELAHELAPDPPDPPDQPGTPARSVDDAGVTPMFVHALRPLDADPDRVLAHLTAEPRRLAEQATAAAVAEAGDALAAGGFRAPVRALVHVERPGPGGLGALRIGWRTDEDATGWPTLTLAVVVEPHRRGARLVLLSAREPRYDLSVNRVDRHQRHEVLRHVGAAMVGALTAGLPATGAAARPDARTGGAAVAHADRPPATRT